MRFITRSMATALTKNAVAIDLVRNCMQLQPALSKTSTKVGYGTVRYGTVGYGVQPYRRVG